MNFRTLIPRKMRRNIRLSQRYIHDLYSGQWKQLANQPATGTTEWPAQIILRQPVLSTAFFENKKHNIRHAAARLAQVVVKPGTIVSFWHTIGAPTEQRGFLPGRNLVEGQLRAEPGGGLCQLASILYHTALLAGFDIVERHHHSVDIYAENERFTPLGSDATVVYGYKDLRLRNTLHQPVVFRFLLENDILSCSVCAIEAIDSQHIIFERTDATDHRTVHTYRADKLIATSVYRLIAHPSGD